MTDTDVITPPSTVACSDAPLPKLLNTLSGGALVYPLPPFLILTNSTMLSS